ncbi:MAG: hypothetical protein OEX01_01170 [Candidatus Bathyarchaeota archaeon]|nr:hypothetical protein [Candidatus Bathyarchaeota archaeon]
MKKATLFLLIFFLSIGSIFLLSPHTTYATSPSQIQVDRIDHVITPIYGGILLINDTIKISPTTENATIENFSIGFPLKYKTNLRFSMAYNAEDFNEQLDVILDAGLGVVGYYGVTVVFPNEVRDLLYNGQPYTFTVIFIFSDLIDSSTEYTFTVDFPLYPSLAQNASTCNVTVILPKNANYTDNDFPFNTTQKSERYYLNYTESPLQNFARMSTKVNFTSKTKDDFACFSVSKLSREITIDTNGHISLSELFLLKSQTAFTVSNIRLQLLKDGSDVSAFDEQGKKLNAELLENETNTYEISLNLVENQSRSFRVVYDLFGENHLVQQDPQSYMLTLSLSENLQMIPQTFTVKIIFPEGAVVKSFPQRTFSIQRGVFQETLFLSLFNITWLQNEQWSFTYSYAIFWASFRPTLWTSALVIIGSIIAFAWQRPKAPVSVSVVLVPRKTLNEFVETYEDKKKILSELEQIKQKARKGKISRRRYKVRKITLENRLSSLSKKLADLQRGIMSGGAKYADMMRRLEVAETELDNIEADIRRIEVRFKRGEISAQTYRRLLEGDLQRREKARITIDGLILRLRE